MLLGFRWINMTGISGGKRSAYHVNYDGWKEWKYAFGEQWALQSLLQAAKNTDNAVTEHQAHAGSELYQFCLRKYPVYIIAFCPMKCDPRRYRNAAARQKLVLSHALKLNLLVMHYANHAIYSHNYGLVQYTCHPQPLQRGLIKTLNVGSFPLREVMRAEHATFCMYSRASIHTEAWSLRQLRGFDSMEWVGLSLPRAWYNESELTKHDLWALSNKLLEATQAWNSTTNSTNSFVHMLFLPLCCVRGGKCILMSNIEWYTDRGRGKSTGLVQIYL